MTYGAIAALVTECSIIVEKVKQFYLARLDKDVLYQYNLIY